MKNNELRGQATRKFHFTALIMLTLAGCRPFSHPEKREPATSQQAAMSPRKADTRLEARLIDESTDPFAHLAETEISDTTIQLIWEPDPRHFAICLRRPEEDLSVTRSRLEAWLKTVRIPTDDVIYYGPFFENVEDGEPLVIGWRTYLLSRLVEFSDSAISEAELSPLLNPYSRGLNRFQLKLEFTPNGRSRLLKLSGQHAGRIIALVINGRVESALPIDEDVEKASASGVLSFNLRGSDESRLSSRCLSGAPIRRKP